MQLFEHSLALPFFGIGIKTDLFLSYGHCWVFQICWHIECNTLIASSLRIWNSSAGFSYDSSLKPMFLALLCRTCFSWNLKGTLLYFAVLWGGLPWWLSSKEAACNAGDLGLIPESGRSPGEGNGYPLQYSCLQNYMDRGAWWAIVHGVAICQTRLSKH